MKIASDWISVASIALITILIISMFYLSSKHSNEFEEQNRTYYSIVWANDVFYKIDEVEAELIELNKKNIDAAGRLPFQNLNYIANNKDIESRVFIILNQYSALGRALKEDLLDLESIRNLRKLPIEQTRRIYEVYLSQYRAQIDAIAWCDFEYLYTEITNNQIYSMPKSCRL